MRKTHVHAPTRINDMRVVGHHEIDKKYALQRFQSFRVFRVHRKPAATIRPESCARQLIDGRRDDTLELGKHNIA
jgi:hypothetical protein